MSGMDLGNLKDLKALKEHAVMAIFADDQLMEMLVLKGGNALSLIYGLSERASFDLDFSISGPFDESQMPFLETRLKQAVENEFQRIGLQVFDFKFNVKPEKIADEVKDFWGGYAVEFKLIETEKYKQFQKNPDTLRRNAIPVGKQRSTKLEIDISKFEYCEDKQLADLNDYKIYVYSPEMLVFEKVRAICQQTESYTQVIQTHRPRARARDFYDIHILMQAYPIDVNTEKNKLLLKRIFDTKKAQVSVTELEASKDLHRSDYEGLRATLPAGTVLHDFEFYYNFVIETFGPLESLWNV